MKTNKLILEVLMMIAVTGMIITGCSKDDAVPGTANDNSNLRYVYDNTIAEASFDDAENVADEGVTGSLSSFKLGTDDQVMTSCATITLQLNAEPHSATIDFGTTDCLGKDGNYRRGKIIVTWSGNYFAAGSSHTISFENYYLNFNKIEGTKTVVNKGRNAEGHLTWDVTVNGKVTVDAQYSQLGTSGTMTFTANKSREWIEGEATIFNRKDDVYLIRGTASGTTTDQVTYTAETDANAPLRKEIGFPHFTRGIVILNANTRGTTMVDYSYLNGQRDNLAQVTVEGVTYTIQLGVRH